MFEYDPKERKLARFGALFMSGLTVWGFGLVGLAVLG